MTTSASSDPIELEILYEGEAPTFGGFVAADFILRRPHQHSLEVNLGLARDAQALFEEQAGTLDPAALQALLRALAERVYPTCIEAGHEPPAILLLRADGIDAATIPAILAEAGLV